MPTLERVANVALRVPSVVLLDLLYRWDVQTFADLLQPRTREPHLPRRHLWTLYYAGHLVCVVVLLLPVRFLVKLYLYILTMLLLYVGHQTVRDYIWQETGREFQGAVYNDPVALSRFATVLTGEEFSGLGRGSKALVPRPKKALSRVATCLVPGGRNWSRASKDDPSESEG
ncbi:RING finger protein 145-like [Sphaerodactylus townsendi]|uniref:RING finger protein 145-like n=1 Tax=Sphaerodactylus townsendi TaxID=933632 RepID=UPI002026FF6B|nr:RING finger protein 145-like [Sphaerodactylus townsendi]